MGKAVWRCAPVGGLVLLAGALVLAGCSSNSRSSRASSSALGAKGSSGNSHSSSGSSSATTGAPGGAGSPTTVVIPTANLPVVTIGGWTGRDPAGIYFSGDSGDIVTEISWSSWGQTEAIGTGTWHYLNCVPNCAQGSSTPYPASITLTDPVGGHFLKLTERTSGPHGFVMTFAAPDLGQGACTNSTENSCEFSS